MAVGEAGYSPRVLLYSTAEDAMLDTPVSIVSDHAIAVKCVAFSPDSRYLATLGNLNDGFLFVWSINPKSGALTLVSTNKCTTNICDMTWCGQTLVTVGTRHVKLWHVGQPAKPTPSKRFKLRSTTEEVASTGPSTLIGRNALLGSLVDCTFTSAEAVDERTLLLGADTGHLCAIEVLEGSPDVKVLKTYPFAITSISLEPTSRRLLLGGQRGVIREEFTSIESLLKSVGSDQRPRSPRKSMRSSIRQSLGLLQSETAGVLALATLTKHSVALDSDGHIHLNSDNDEEPELSFACHNDLIQGVQKLPPDCDLGAFFTWSRRGEVRFWDTGGTLLSSAVLYLDQQEVDQDGDPNELRVVRYISNSRQFLAGDRFGVIKLLSTDWTPIWTGRAHGAEVTDIAVHTDCNIVATCGRDRMVQLFRVKEQELELVQTSDDHIGAVTQVLFTPNADRLLSCSADRTIVVRDRARRGSEGAEVTAYISARVITLRSSPLSMTFFDLSASTLVTATSDRHLVKVDPTTGAILETNKVTDPENDDTVALSSICLSGRGFGAEETCNLLAAYSSTDKSVRVYDADKSLLLTRESGHTEGVSDLCLIERQNAENRTERILVSTGLDGTIMLWNIALSIPAVFTPMQEVAEAQTMQGWESDGTPVKPSPVSLPPLRKVLTKMDMIEFTKSPAMSPSSARSLSPPRLTRKRSTLAMSSTIDEKEEEHHTEATPRSKSIPTITDSDRSPSPPPQLAGTLRKQRSAMDMNRKVTGRRSPSPPPFAVSQPSTPRHRSAANNSRLRRPPSVPTDLRGQALAQRRQSMTATSDFGSMGMATEQACRMLRTYRKKLMASKEDLGLEELEDELELISKLVRERKERVPKVPAINENLTGSVRGKERRTKAKAATESDVDDLVALMERTNMKERQPQGLGLEVKV
jgi:WD40 repeat protein